LVVALWAAGLAGCTTTVAPVSPPPTPQETSGLLTVQAVNWSDAMQSAAYFSLHRATDPREIESLIQCLEVEGVREFVMRENAARALALAGDTRAIPALIRRLDEDPDEDVRKAAAHALGALRAVDAVPELLARIFDLGESHWVTAEAAEALGDIGDVSVIFALEQFRRREADFWMEVTALDIALEKLRARRDQPER
jgi:HEAT repeat protein